MGAKLAILPTSLYSSTDTNIRQQTRDRRAILEKMMQDQKDTEDAEEELSRIKSERQRVEEELERLRKLLEEEKKKREAEIKKEKKKIKSNSKKKKG